MKEGEYHYIKSGSMYRIYQCDYSRNGIVTSSPVYSEPYMFTDPEEARKRVYELNGWKYKPLKKKDASSQS